MNFHLTHAFFRCRRILWLGLQIFLALNVWGQDIQNPQLPSRSSWSRAGVGDILKLKREQVEPTVFTASRQAQRLSDAPATIHLITDKDIQIRGYLSLKDVLDDLVEFKFDEYGSELFYNAVNVRGVRGQDKFIIMFDGIRISSPTNEALPIIENYPVRNVKQIEVVTSAASALYGADAMTGVINIIPYSASETETVRAGVYGGRFNYYSADALYTKKIRKLNLRLQGQYNRDGQPNYPQIYGGPDSVGLGSYQRGIFPTIFGADTLQEPIQQGFSALRESYFWEVGASYQDLHVSILQHSARTPSSMAYNLNNGIYNDDAFLRNTVTSYSATYRKTIAKVFNSTTLSYSTYELDPQSNYRYVYTTMKRGYKYAFGSMFQLDQQNGFNLSERLHVTVGLNVQAFTSVPRGEDLDRPVDPNFRLRANLLNTDIPAEFTTVRFHNYGTYIQLIARPFQRLTITGGGRYDYNTRFKGVFNPRLGMTYKLTSHSTVKCFYGSAFLAPSSFEMNNRFGTPSIRDIGEGPSLGFIWRQVPNPDLKPIHLESVEVTYALNIGQLNLDVTAYYLWLRDAFSIKFFGDSTLRPYGLPIFRAAQQTVNSGRQEHYGLALDASYRIVFNSNSNWLIYGGVGYLEGISSLTPNEREYELISPLVQSIDNRQAPIPYISNGQFRLGHDLTWNKWTLSVRTVAITRQRMRAIVDYDYIVRITNELNALQNTLDPFTDSLAYAQAFSDFEQKQESYYARLRENPKRLTIGGYAVFHVNLTYQVLKNMRLSLQVQNLTNVRYHHTTTNGNPSAFAEEFRSMPQMPLRIIGGLHLRL
jgi:outer membrane receptor protein involved in Fe transport